jgi:hypothetical protein
MIWEARRDESNVQNRETSPPISRGSHHHLEENKQQGAQLIQVLSLRWLALGPQQPRLENARAHRPAFRHQTIKSRVAIVWMI